MSPNWALNTLLLQNFVRKPIKFWPLIKSPRPFCHFSAISPRFGDIHTMLKSLWGIHGTKFDNFYYVIARRKCLLIGDQEHGIINARIRIGYLAPLSNFNNNYF